MACRRWRRTPPGEQDEAYISAVEDPPASYSWVSRTHEDGKRPRGVAPPAGEGPPSARGHGAEQEALIGLLLSLPSSLRTFPKTARLLRSAEFERAQRRGTRRASDLLTLHVVSNEAGRARFGLAVGKRVGNAVVRNRVKRHLREGARHLRRRVSAVDVVIAARPAAGRAAGVVLRAELERILGRLGVLSAEGVSP